MLQMLHFKKIASNTFFQFIVRLINSTSTLIITLLISYFLGITTLGSFTKIVTFVSFFYLLVDFGLNSMYVKIHAKNSEDNLQNLLLLRLFLGAIFFVGAGIITVFLPYNPLTGTGFSPAEKTGVLLYSLTIITFGLNLSLTAFLQRKLLYHVLLLPTVASSVVLLGLVFLGIEYKNLNIIVYSYFISQVVMFFVLMIKLRNTVSFSFTLKGFRPFAKRLLFVSFPLALMLFFNLLYAKIDTLILAFYKGNFDVGIYGFSYRIFEFIIAVPTFLANSLYPVLLDNEKKKKTFLKILKNYSFTLFLLAVAATVAVFIFSPLLPFIKKDFAYSELPLQILSLSFPFFFLTSLFQWVLIIKNKKRVLVILYLLALIANVCLNILFVPIYSYIASAIITVLCEGVVFFAMIFYLLFRKAKIFDTETTKD